MEWRKQVTETETPRENGGPPEPASKHTASRTEEAYIRSLLERHFDPGTIVLPWEYRGDYERLRIECVMQLKPQGNLGDHFKTGHRGSLQNRPTDHHPGQLVLPYRLAVWQVQFWSSPVIIVGPEMPGAIPSAMLQDQIPVFPFLHRKVSFEN